MGIRPAAHGKLPCCCPGEPGGMDVLLLLRAGGHGKECTASLGPGTASCGPLSWRTDTAGDVCPSRAGCTTVRMGGTVRMGDGSHGICRIDDGHGVVGGSWGPVGLRDRPGHHEPVRLRGRRGACRMGEVSTAREHPSDAGTPTPNQEPPGSWVVFGQKGCPGRGSRRISGTVHLGGHGLAPPFAGKRAGPSSTACRFLRGGRASPCSAPDPTGRARQSRMPAAYHPPGRVGLAALPGSRTPGRRHAGDPHGRPRGSASPGEATRSRPIMRCCPHASVFTCGSGTPAMTEPLAPTRTLASRGRNTHDGCT